MQTHKFYTVEDRFKPGAACTINDLGDLYMEAEARKFIGAECEVIKMTKAGLVQVRLKADPRMVYSAPRRNVDLI